MAQSGPNPFLITTPLEQPDRVSRRDARSYAMRGKNSGKSRKSLVKRPYLGSWISGHVIKECCQNKHPPSHEQGYINLIPGQIGSQWTLFQFAEEIEPYILQSTFQFYSVLEQTLHPNHIFVTEVCGPQASIWFSNIIQSQTSFHTQLFVTTAYLDLKRNGDAKIGPVATAHMTKALSCLRTDLATVDQATTEPTINAVTAFTMSAFVLGDTASAGNHLHGLFKLVTMRGGLRSLGEKSYLQTKCCRLDLGYAMSTGSKPLFFANDMLSWDSYLPRSTLVSWNSALDMLIGGSKRDQKMVNVWNDLYEFSRSASIATQTGRKLESALLQEVMISVQYRLLHLQYDNEDDHELLRIVMLAYSTTIYPSVFSHFGASHLHYRSLSICLRGLLARLKQPSEEILNVLLWLLVILGMTIFDDELINHQLAHTVQAMGLSSWDEILVILKRFLWIDVLHEEQARRILNT